MRRDTNALLHPLYYSSDMRSQSPPSSSEIYADVRNLTMHSPEEQFRHIDQKMSPFLVPSSTIWLRSNALMDAQPRAEFLTWVYRSLQMHVYDDNDADDAEDDDKVASLMAEEENSYVVALRPLKPGRNESNRNESNVEDQRDYIVFNFGCIDEYLVCWLIEEGRFALVANPSVQVDDEGDEELKEMGYIPKAERVAMLYGEEASIIRIVGDPFSPEGGRLETVCRSGYEVRGVRMGARGRLEVVDT